MDFIAPDVKEEPLDPDAIIVKADEVDEAGADISAISPTNASESEFNDRIESRRQHDAQTSSPKILANAVPSPPRPIPRPILRREGSAPSPPKQPPPPAPLKEPVELEGRPTDSLSLQQLKKLVGDLHKIEPTAYAYEYSETRGFAEEVQEWFVYNEEERLMLLRAKEDFEERWAETFSTGMNEDEDITSWVEATEDDRSTFTKTALSRLEDEGEDDIGERVKNLECLSYIALGVWGDAAGRQVDEKGAPDSESKTDDHRNSEDTEHSDPQSQVNWMTAGASLLCRFGAVKTIVNIFKKLWESEQSVSRLAFSLIDNDGSLHADSLSIVEISQNLRTYLRNLSPR